MLINKVSGMFALKVLFLIAVSGSLLALQEPDGSGVGQAEFRSDILNIDNLYKQPKELPAQALANATADLNALGVRSDSAHVDQRGGRWASLLLSEPLIPGNGQGNGLKWVNLGRKAPKNDKEHGNAASQAFKGYLEANSHPLRIDMDELAGNGKVTVNRGGNSIQIYMPRVFEGVKVRGSHLAANINNGNLILFGTENWGDIETSTEPKITESAALEAVQAYIDPYAIDGAWGKSELLFVPVNKGQDVKNVPVGKGFDYRLVWVLRPAFDSDQRRFEALVDAHIGVLLSFEDTNQYAEVKGGVLPVTNDGIVPDGVEQAGWPMPYADATDGTTDTGGNIATAGSVTTDFYGPYVNINDNCGSSSLTSASGVLDWGTSSGTDCATPGFGGAGNTHASRTGFYELNKIIEMGRGQLPSNSWLQQRLTANMNINLSCNAFWGGGTVNFYRHAPNGNPSGCFNTGEIAGVFDHEWGHGLDDNDAVPTIANPSGEGIADIYTALRLNDSCIGRNFRSTVCSGNGDPCLTCTGVRDIDYAKRASGNPHDFSWSNANCGGSVHCKGGVYSEAVWSLWKRELQGAPYNYDNNTAHEIVTRLTYIGGGNTGTWFSGGPPNGGCSSSSGYKNFLAADDDNGNLSDGTPHMSAIYNAFNDQEIACQDLTVQDSGCAGTPTTAPSVTATAFNKSVDLSWGAVSGATEYEVFRTEGVFACDFGKVKLDTTTGTSFNDSGLQNGRAYSYVVIPKGNADGCFGPASSCDTVTPVSGPGLDIDPAPIALTIAPGDSDDFIDNCEDATLDFEVKNTGLGSLTNVRITGVTVVSPSGTTIHGSFPAAVSPATLGQGAIGTGSFDFTAGVLTFGDTLVFEVTVTADEMSGGKTQTLSLDNAESDLLSVVSQTWDFETDLDGWTLIEGTFNQTTSGGGAGSSAGYLASSALLDYQCDQVRSPAFQLTAASTMTLQNNYEIENFSSSQWWDRANIAVLEAGVRSAVEPNGGRLYNATGVGATCATAGQSGWANVNNGWGLSSWSASALGSAGRAGQTVQLDVAYGTDAAANGKGFWFDKVTVTNIEQIVADGQTDICGGPVNNPPVVTITGPSNDAIFNVGDTINFTGTASDDEDGPLVNAINWNSSIDSDFGSTGDNINYAGLSAGVHTITASATDSGDPTSIPKTGTGQISITVRENTAPVVTITGPADGSSFNEGDSINFTGTASDTEDGSLSVINWNSSINGDFGDAGNDINYSGLSKGDHTITASITDSGNPTGNPKSGDDTIAVTINEPPTSVSVHSIVTSTQNAPRGKKRGVATVIIVDSNENPISGYTVAGTFGAPFNETVSSGSTGTDGTIEIVTATEKKLKGEVSFCVSNVTAVGGLPYYRDGNSGYACPVSAVNINSFSASPTTINEGQTTTLNWTVSNAVSCTASGGTPGWDGDVASDSGSHVENTLTEGTYIFTLTCYDSSTFDVADATVIVNPPTPGLTDVHVENINTGQQGVGGGDKAGTATVTIFGDNGVAQQGYAVSGNFSGDFNESVGPLETESDGSVKFETGGVKRGKVNVSFCVTAVTGAELYDPSDNPDSGYDCSP